MKAEEKNTNTQTERTPRPTILEIEDAKKEMSRLINKYNARGVPFYLLRDAFSGLFTQIGENAKKEVEAALAAYQTKIIEEGRAAKVKKDSAE